MTVEFWPYWIAFGGACGAALIGAVFGYNTKESIKQWRWIFMMAVYMFSAIGYGFLAFGQTYLLRDDGLKILFGRWWLEALVNPFAAVTVIIGFTQFLPNHLATFVFTGISSLALVGLAYTPSNGGTDAQGPLIFWFCVSVCAVLALFLYLIPVAMNWTRFWYFPREPHSAEFRTPVQNYFWYALTVAALCLCLLFYALLAALGPEGWDRYDRSLDKRETLQIWLTLLVDLLFKFILLPLVYFALDPSGTIGIDPFALARSAADIDSEVYQSGAQKIVNHGSQYMTIQQMASAVAAAGGTPVNGGTQQYSM
jgi:hypothetical protein